MQRLVLTGAIFVVLMLLHFSILDLRHRHRGGLTWFWLGNPAPPAIWLSRLAMAGAAVVALSTLWVVPSRDLALLMLALLLVHIGLLEAWSMAQIPGEQEPPR